MHATHPSVAHVGLAIRAARESAGYSQDEFALLVGIDRSYFGHVERGSKNVTIELLFRVAQRLQIEPASLMPSLADMPEFQPKQPNRTKRTARRPKN